MEPIAAVMGRTILYIGNKLSSSKTNPTTQTTLAEGLKAEGYTVISASPLQNKVLRLSHMILVFLKNARKADYVLIDVYSTQNFWYAVLIAKLAGTFSKKYIPILHGGDLKKRFRRSPAATHKLLGNAYCIISPSLYLQKEVKEMGISDVRYIPNPLFLRKYAFKQRENLSPKLLWVRAFDEIYNPLLALKCLKLLLKSYPGAELCMVGPDKDGSLGKCRRYAAKHRLPVTFTGKMKKKEWTALAAKYDIFLNTSDIDNTPVSVIEAMALGIPVVTTNVGGIPYLIEDKRTGYLVAPGDPATMAERIEDLLQNPGNAFKFSRCGRGKTKEFDWELIKAAWHKVLT